MSEVKDIDREAAKQYWAGWSPNLPEVDGEIHPLVSHLAAHREASEKAERDRIVAWLREMQEGRTSDNYPGHFALRIERGEHLG